MDLLMTSGIIIVVFLLFLIIGMPIGFALAITSLTGIIIFDGFGSLSSIVDVTWGSTDNFILTAIPMFILMSEIIVVSDIGKDLFNVLDSWLRKIPGGLAVSSVLSSAVFGSVSGTAVGVVAVVGPLAIPEMRQKGYSDELAIGSVTAASGLGVIIPPSLALILYGVVTETSVGKLFISGIIPGITLAILFALYVVFISMKNKDKMEVEDDSKSWREKLVSTFLVIPILTLIVIVIGGIYLGVMTPTESAGVGVIVSLILSLFYRRLTWTKLVTALRNTAKSSSMILLILIAAMLFSHLMSITRIPRNISLFIQDMDVNKWVIISAIMIFCLIMGMFLDGGAVVLLVVPIVFPTVMTLGFDPYWFAIMIMIVICTSTVTPPVGLSSYFAKSIVPDVSLGKIFKSAVPFIFINILALIILSLFPKLALFLIE